MSDSGDSWLKTWFSTTNPMLMAVCAGLNHIGTVLNRMHGLPPIVVERPSGGPLIRHLQPETAVADDEDCIILGCWDAVGEAVSEGAEAAETTDQAVGDLGQPLRLYAMTRVAYYHEGDKKLYGYVRALTIDAFGHITHVSGETRVEVDVTERC